MSMTQIEYTTSVKKIGYEKTENYEDANCYLAKHMSYTR